MGPCCCGTPGVVMIARVPRDGGPRIATPHCDDCAESYWDWLYGDDD